MALDYRKIKEFWEKRARLASEEKLKAVNLGTKPEQSEIQLEFLLKNLSSEDQKIIDLGCGAGRVAIPAARRSLEVTAVDFSKTMLEVLEKNLQLEKVENVKVLQGECYSKLPVDYGTFDAALIFGVLIHLNDAEVDKTIANAAALIKKTGKIIVRESVGTEGHFEVDRFSEELQCDYHAVYRTPADIEGRFKTNGFSPAFSQKLYQQRKETGTWFWVFKTQA